MLRRAFWAAPAALALAGAALAKPRSRPAAPTPAAPPPPHAAGLIGAWSLVAAEIYQDAGAARPAFGDRPTGLLIYDRSGTMSLQIAGDRPMVNSIETFQSLRPEDCMVFLDSYYAYFGIFEINEAEHAVIHRVHASLRPNETGISYHRQYAIEGERLLLASPPETHAGVTTATRLTFVRIASPA